MKWNHKIRKAIPAITAAVLTVLLVGYLLFNPAKDFTTTLPGLDKRGKGNLLSEIIKIGEHFKLFQNRETPLSESWPRFRGADFDNINKTKTKLIDNFSGNRGEILWQHQLGEGHAGPAIFEGKVYLLNYNEEERADMLHCYNLQTGEELWRRWYNVNIKRNHGMSRTVPAVSDRFILTIGPRCHVMCLNRQSGDLLWGIDIEKEYESETPLWYTGQCPLIDNETAILATGGKALMVAIDCATGEKLWEVPNPNAWKMSHSSIMPFTFNGVKMYVYAAVGGAVGISDKGEILWTLPEWNTNVIAPSPVCMPDGRIFFSAGYGAGSMMVQLKSENGKIITEILQQYKPREGLATEQQTAIYWQGHLFGIMPKDGGTWRNQLVCVHPNDPTNILWASDKDDRFGLGPFICADGKFYLLNDDGTMHIIKADTRTYHHLNSKTIIENGHDAWAPLAIADGYMVLRDADRMVCIRIGELDKN